MLNLEICRIIWSSSKFIHVQDVCCARWNCLTAVLRKTPVFLNVTSCPRRLSAAQYLFWKFFIFTNSFSFAYHTPRYLLLQNYCPNSYFLRQFWSHIYIIYVLQKVRRFFVIYGCFFFNFFSFLKCLIYMLIVILLHFIESFLLLKTSSKNLRLFATIIRFTKAFCRHPQHIFMIFGMFQVFKIFIVRIFFFP